MTGLELRACWEEGRRAASSLPVPTSGRPSGGVRDDGAPPARPDPMRLRGFVPVEELSAPDDPRRAGRQAERSSHAERAWVPSSPPAVAENAGGAIDDWEKRVSLFGEADS